MNATDTEEMRADDDAPIERVEVTPVMRKVDRPNYQKRIKIHPKRARGSFRRLKWAIMAITLAIYYGTPWIRWDRGANMPDQAVLIDFPARRFYFFFIEIWPQEVYYLTGLLILASLGLFLLTALAGRVWCGYSCPQTVWTDLFLVVERAIEGDRAARIRLDKAPLSAAKIGKRTAKHLLWIVIGLTTGGAWVFYFADAPTLAIGLVTGDAAPIAYITIAVLTASTYLFGGHAREQVCIYMCPWPRIQGALFDEHSLLVAYKTDRGEPRGRYRKGEDWSGRGDCVDCQQCVVVCPMGIDIRDGSQLECITCALCIDACDDVMGKIGRPKGLIGYDTAVNETRRAENLPPRTRLIRPRTIAYTALMVVVSLVMLATLVSRPVLEVNIQHKRNPLFVKLSNGDVRNGYTIKILNKLHEDRRFTLSLDGLAGATLSVTGQEQGANGLLVKSDNLRAFRVFIAIPAKFAPKGGRDITLIVTDEISGESAQNDTIFRGPET